MPALQQLKVMVVDRDPRHRIGLVECLNAVGIAAVGTSGDGEAALMSLMARPCDAVFLTRQLPRLGGPQLLKALRAQHTAQQCRAILVVDSDDAAAALQGRALGFDATLPRPFTPSMVLAVLESLLGRLS